MLDVSELSKVYLFMRKLQELSEEYDIWVNTPTDYVWLYDCNNGHIAQIDIDKGKYQIKID